jgi:hypothetical protein
MTSTEAPAAFDFDFNFNDDFDLTAPRTGSTDNNDDSDDQSETDEKNDKGLKKRPTIREHSKAQREKRKSMLESLERDAALVTKQKVEKDSQHQRVFDSIENSRKLYLRRVALFLQLWFGVNPLSDGNEVTGADSGISHIPTGTKGISSTRSSGTYDPLDKSKSSWSYIVEEIAVVTMPLTMAFWVPPTTSCATNDTPSSSSPKVDRHRRLSLRTFAQLKGYQAGYRLLCSSIAR